MQYLLLLRLIMSRMMVSISWWLDELVDSPFLFDEGRSLRHTKNRSRIEVPTDNREWWSIWRKLGAIKTLWNWWHYYRYLKTHKVDNFIQMLQNNTLSCYEQIYTWIKRSPTTFSHRKDSGDMWRTTKTKQRHPIWEAMQAKMERSSDTISGYSNG